MINVKALKFAALFLAVILPVGMPHNLRADILIDGYTAAVNDRFTNDPSFVLNGTDLSAVGQTTGGRWATAISPNVIVSATHFDPNGQVVSFYPGNDSNATPVTRTVISGQAVINDSTNNASDLWIGLLDSNLPASITPVDYASTTLTAAFAQPSGGGIDFSLMNTNPVPFAGENAYLFGRSPDGASTVTNQAVGRNEITGYLEDVVVAGRQSDALFTVTDSPGLFSDFVTNEATLQTFDSGGPMFVIESGQLLLLGVNAFNVPDPDNPGDFIGSGFDYIGNEATFIDGFIDANAVNSVPEPGSVLALSIIMGAGLVRRRRQS